MLNFLIYILEVSVLTSVFFLFYRYLYFKFAYFVWSRYYFYAALIISLIIPLLPGLFEVDLIIYKIDSLIGVSENKSLGYVYVQNSYLNNTESFLSSFPIIEILFIIWISGFIRYMFIISKSLVSIVFTLKKGERQKEGKYTIVKINSNKPAFSFFNYVFVNKEFESLSKTEKIQITDHEKIHAKQKHTIDNLIFEVFRAVFWFNPISRLISANIKIIHEFIVDNELTGNKNVPDYSRLLLKLATHRSHALTVSSFSKEEITSRIKLITFPEKEKVRKIRFAASIPVLIITVFATWIIISTANTYMFSKTKTEKIFHTPFNPKNYKLISPFFENRVPGEIFRGKEQNINETQSYTVSHKEATYEVKDYSKAYAIESGTISRIKKKDIYGLTELTIKLESKNGYTIEYIGIYRAIINKDDAVNKGDIIGLTGDIRLYPSVSIKITKDDECLNPEKLY